MKSKLGIFILSVLMLAACNPSTSSDQSNQAASDTGSILDTAGNTAIDSANVNRVEGQGQMQSPSSSNQEEQNESHNTGGSRVNSGRDTAGEFKQEKDH